MKTGTVIKTFASGAEHLIVDASSICRSRSAL
jgi:hypothetical protein